MGRRGASPEEGERKREGRQCLSAVQGVERWRAWEESCLQVWEDLSGQEVQLAPLWEAGRLGEGVQVRLLGEGMLGEVVRGLLEEVVMPVKVGQEIQVEAGRLVEEALVLPGEAAAHLILN